jgi:3-deoxy-manno-octulosonate cytidylyltransferase (CMP-KDO synthetase)
MKIIAIIPARYNSSRFPGKPLAQINDKTMIQRVYEQTSKVIENVFVATDDFRIANEVKRFGGNVILTSENHKSGTDRCAETLDIVEKELNLKFDIVINVQGDEPFINPEQIIQISKLFDDADVEIATLIKPTFDQFEINNKNTVKVLIDENMFAINFSRSPLQNQNSQYFKHIGMYAYRTEVLKKITKLSQSPMEILESLEQLRWIENSYKIKTAITQFETISIDTIDDLEKAKFHAKNI